MNDVQDSTFYYYDKAFSEFDFVFAKDAFIAAQFAWIHQNKDKTTAYLVKGAQSGLTSSCLYESPIMTSFTNSRFYDEVYMAMKDANAGFESTIDAEQRKDWRARFDEQKLDLINNEEGDFLSAVVRNVEQVKKLISTGNYPGEKIIGLSDDYKQLGNPDVFYAMANYDCVISEMHDALWDAVKKGQMHPREFATLWEWEYIRSAQRQDLLNKKVLRYIAGKFVILGFKDHPYIKTNRNCSAKIQKVKHFRLLLDLTDVNDEDINRDRQMYFITSLELDKKKAELEGTKGFRFFFENK